MEIQPRPTPNTTLRGNGKYDLEKLDWTINQHERVESETTVIPAVVVVTVLAIPIVLVLIALLMQIMRKRHRVMKAAHKRQLQTKSTSNRRGLCAQCCCFTRKYYYDTSRGFDKLVKGSTDESTDDEEEDLFTRKA